MSKKDSSGRASIAISSLKNKKKSSKPEIYVLSDKYKTSEESDESPPRAKTK